MGTPFIMLPAQSYHKANRMAHFHHSWKPHREKNLSVPIFFKNDQFPTYSLVVAIKTFLQKIDKGWNGFFCKRSSWDKMTNLPRRPKIVSQQTRFPLAQSVQANYFNKCENTFIHFKSNGRQKMAKCHLKTKTWRQKWFFFSTGLKFWK